jgi:predicted amidohydrolase
LSEEPFKIAAVQAASAFLDLDASVSKACELIEEAAGYGARLIAFPEAFIPGYPLWVWFIPPGKTHPLRALYHALHQNSVAIPGPAVARLAEACADHSVTVAIGVNERNSEGSDSTLFNTLLYLGPEGQILGKHLSGCAKSSLPRPSPSPSSANPVSSIMPTCSKTSA